MKRVLLQIALRNLFTGFLNLVIGAIILGGTFFFVLGSSLLRDIDSAMSRSITGSIGGHLQVYSSKSKDELTLFNNWTYPDLAAMPDFSKVKRSLEAVDNVKTVIPMGVNGAFLTYGNTMDLALEKLRDAVKLRLGGDRSAGTAELIESRKTHVRGMIALLASELEKLSTLVDKKAIEQENVEVLAKASSAAFWADFDKAPLDHLEFLENKIASLLPDGDYIYLNYVGTDLDAYQQSFDRMELVDGTAVPKGKRGMLLSKYTYEEFFKLKAARRLDKIHEALADEGKTIAGSAELRELIKENRTQTRELALQLDPLAMKAATAKLQAFLDTKEEGFSPLISQLFDLSDANFKARYDFFYKELAPMLELYRLRPGDYLPIKAYSKSGFVQSANVKVYGTFRFKGLEKSGLAGSVSLMDLMSFRDLYGYMTPDKLAEMKALQEAAGARIVEKDRAEAELFGGESSVRAVQAKRIDDKAELESARANAKAATAFDPVYSTEEIEKGVALNAAVILKDPSRMKATMKAVEAAALRDGLDLKVVTWQKAAGAIGQLVYVAKAILYLSVFIIFVVAMVVINNAVMMATLQRIREIGTMRAIGAQRGFVLAMVLVESLTLGAVFGSLGTGLGAAAIAWLGKAGIPARNEFLYFFFSGPRLFTTLSAGSILGAFVLTVLVTTLSAMYPALIAARVSPVQAMQAED